MISISVIGHAIKAFMILRFGLVSLVNTTVGILAFPALKTIFPLVSNGVLMTIAYLACVFLSFVLHGRYTFRGQLSFLNLFLFFSVNSVLLFAMIFSVNLLVDLSDFDVRLIQPVIAVTFQLFAVIFYKLIFSRGKL